MALIKCKECGKDVSNQAEKCPNCGAVVKKKTGCLTQLFAVFVFGFILLIIYGACSGEVAPVPTKKDTITVSAVAPEGFINEPVNVGPFTIKVTQVKESKKIGKYKPHNMYVQVFAEITNNSHTDANAPHFSLHNEKVKGLAACTVDGQFVVGDVKGSLLNAEWIKAGKTKKGYFPFTCLDYIQSPNHPEKNSKPSDFKMFIYDKLNSRQTGNIRLTFTTK